MPDLSSLFSKAGFLKWDGAGNAASDFGTEDESDLAADPAFTGAFVALPPGLGAEKFAAVAGTPAKVYGTGQATWLLDGAGATEAVVASFVHSGPEVTITPKALVSNRGAGSGDVKLTLNYAVITAGDSIAEASTSASVTFTALAQNVAQTTASFASIVIPAGALVRLQVSRNSADAADTLGNDLGLDGLSFV